MSRTTHDIAPDPGALEALLHGRLGDPFSVLGPHRGKKGTVIRTFQPGATAVEVHPLEKEEADAPLQPIDASGMFGGEVALNGPCSSVSTSRSIHAARSRTSIICTGWSGGARIGPPRSARRGQ